MRPVRLLVVGDVVTDVSAVQSGPLAVGSDTPAAIRTGGGGSAANTAAWLAGTGAQVWLVAVVGGDAFADARLSELVAAKVSCDFVRRATNAPTGTVIVLAHHAERTMIADRGANLLLAPSDVDLALARSEATHLHLSGYPLLDDSSRPAGRHALAAATEAGLTTSVDAASAAPLRRVGGTAFLEWVRGTDLLIANVDEACALLGYPDARQDPADLARRLAHVARHVVVKLGPAGAIWAGPEGDTITGPAVPASVVDPTGAGDAFAAGLLASWLAGGDPTAALDAGAHLGAAAVETIGGRPTTSRRS
jgi:ribokinase